MNKYHFCLPPLCPIQSHSPPANTAHLTFSMFPETNSFCWKSPGHSGPLLCDTDKPGACLSSVHCGTLTAGISCKEMNDRRLDVAFTINVVHEVLSEVCELALGKQRGSRMVEVDSS